MPLKSTIFLSGRKYIYHGTHLVVVVVIFFVFVVVMNSTLIQSKEKKFWEKIYYNYLQSSNDLKSGEKKRSKFLFCFFALCLWVGWKYICHYSKHRVNLKKKTLLGAGLVFFLFTSEIFLVRPMEIFFGQIFFISLLIKATEGIFLVMVYSSSLMIPSFIHVKKSDKTQGDILILGRGGIFENKNNKGGLRLAAVLFCLDETELQTQQIKRPNKHYVACVCPCTRGSL